MRRQVAKLFRERALVIAAEPCTAVFHPDFADGELCTDGRVTGDLDFGDVGDEGGVCPDTFASLSRRREFEALGGLGRRPFSRLERGGRGRIFAA